MLDSQFAQARSPLIVETAAMTMPAEPFTSPTAPPPKAHQPRTPTVPVVLGPSNDKGFEDVGDEVEIVHLDPKYSKGPGHVKKEPSTVRTSRSTRPPGGVAIIHLTSEGVMYIGGGHSPAPTQNSPTDLGPNDMEHFEAGAGDFPGDDEDPGDEGNGSGGGGGGPPHPPDRNNGSQGDRIRKLPREINVKALPREINVKEVLVLLMVMMVGMTPIKMMTTMMKSSVAR